MTKIKDTPMSVRLANILHEANIQSVEELTEYSEKELLKIRNMGKKSISEISKYVLLEYI